MSSIRMYSGGRSSVALGNIGYSRVSLAKCWQLMQMTGISSGRSPIIVDVYRPWRWRGGTLEGEAEARAGALGVDIA